MVDGSSAADCRGISSMSHQLCPWQPWQCKSHNPLERHHSLQAPALINPKVHSSLEALSSGEKMAATPTNVELWEAEMIMTVCRRTRASRQIFSRPLHSLGAAAEVTEAPSGWQDEAVLFSVPPEGLSILESHRTSQHSASLSDGCSPKSPEKQMAQGKNADFSLLITRFKVIWSRDSWY